MTTQTLTTYKKLTGYTFQNKLRLEKKNYVGLTSECMMVKKVFETSLI